MASTMAAWQPCVVDVVYGEVYAGRVGLPVVDGSALQGVLSVDLGPEDVPSFVAAPESYCVFDGLEDADDVFVNSFHELETKSEVLAPAVKGTSNVLNACSAMKVQKIFLFTVAKESSKFLPILKETAKSFKGKLLFVFVERDNEEVGERVANYFGITRQETTVLAYTGNEDAKKFFFSGEISLDNIKAVVKATSDRVLLPHSVLEGVMRLLEMMAMLVEYLDVSKTLISRKGNQFLPQESFHLGQEMTSLDHLDGGGSFPFGWRSAVKRYLKKAVSASAVHLDSTELARGFLRVGFHHLPAGLPPMFNLVEQRPHANAPPVGLVVHFTNRFDAYHLLGKVYWCGCEFIAFTTYNIFTDFESIFPARDRMHSLPYYLGDNGLEEEEY
ncbi:Protein disulfide isomerase-like 1-4 [Hordeum vulgare]|nr:Protein disulfide isomerase-like 1-4 [Hordeum vulgare]